MGKHRALDSKIRTSETFASFTYRQRDLWHGLIAVADDQGRMSANPRYIRSQVWPYDEISEAEVREDLEAIEKAGNILIYEVDNRCYIQIINWWKYQRGEWFSLSDYPAPPGWSDRARYHGKGANNILLLNWDTPGGYVATPTTTLPTQLPSQLPSGVLSRDVNGDVKGKGEGEEEGNTAAPPAAPPIPKTSVPFMVMDAQRVFTEVTGMVTFPSSSRDADIDRITALFGAHNGGLAEYLRPFYAAWTGPPHYYNKANTAWLDWAIAGEIPLTKAQQEERRFNAELEKLHADHD